MSLFNISALAAIFLLAACSRGPARPDVQTGKQGNANGSNQGSALPDPNTEMEGVPPVIQGPEIRPDLKLEPLALIMGEALPECSDASQQMAAPAMRLMMSDEYQNTLKEVLGVAKDYRVSLPLEAVSKGYRGLGDLNLVSDAHMDAYLSNAFKIADEMQPKLANLSAEQIVDQYASRLWRRPLEAAEKQKLLNLAKTSDNPEESASVLLAGLLTSPNFLYRSEIGKDGTLNAFERASALSYFFWLSPPDDELRKLAESGEILKDEVFQAQARRYLASPRAKAGIQLFTSSYAMSSGVVNAAKDSEKFKGWTQETRDLLAKEANDTMDFWVREKKSKYAELFNADYSVADPKLAGFYQAQSKKEGNTDLLTHNNNRRGLLGWASVLSTLATATESHPVKRGEFVMEHLLCDKMAPTPAGLEVKVPPPKPGVSTRERFKEHSTSPACAGCHLKLDGAGFGLEDFDAIGQHRTQDESKNVDASGTVFGIDGKDTPFNGGASLSKFIAESKRGQRCLAVHLFQLSRARLMKEPAANAENLADEKKYLIRDVCTARKIADEFVAENASIAELMVKIISNPAFMKRGR